jgi:group I intron endonuclease
MTCGIYKLTIPSGRSYTGQSVNIEDRFIEHKKEARTCFNSVILKSPSKLRSAYKKYSWNQVVKEIIEICSPEQLNEREVFYIILFDTFNNGLNSTSGGDSNFTRSEETKNKLREINLGKRGGPQAFPFYVDGVRYVSILDASSKLNIPHKTIHNRLNSKNDKYANYVYEDISKIPKRKTIRPGRSYAVISVKIDGVIYETASEASRKLNIPSTTIIRRARSHSKKFSNYELMK